ncbi:hypothetical protein TIFTF001_030306 [Ficus carica]|uniref:Uncharacterized protein n=1 Tax=Ficus carica TaxID=3494 RepID=A0AA88DXD6_FICCA|nr:hypothetical protein TIFTF001_030306 [Ficus carica]
MSWPWRGPSTPVTSRRCSLSLSIRLESKRSPTIRTLWSLKLGSSANTRKISGETQVGDGVVVGDGEKGEVVGGVRVAEENMTVVEQLEATAEPRVIEQTNTRADPPSEQ